MTWTVAITLAVGVILKLLMSPPSVVVKWILSKFALHSELNLRDFTVTFNGNHLVEEEKIRFTNYFNEAIFLKKYCIFPGNEELFLHPETNVSPFVINVRSGKKNIKLTVYCYEDRVDVVKQYNKKIYSYALRSNNPQNITLPPKVSNLI